MNVVNQLLGYNKFDIVQNTQMFSFSLDSILLPGFITINKKTKKILDIGTGNAPIPLILSTMTDAKIIGVEIQKGAYELAKKSIEINKLNDQIDIINGDILDVIKNYETDSFDIITCNPPYFKVNKDANFNQSEYKTIARHEVFLNIEDVIKISKKLLKNNGLLGLVHRPERLCEIIMLLEKYNLEPKKLQFVYSKRNSNANIILIEAKKNGNTGLKIMKPLYVHEDNGEYSKQVKDFFERGQKDVAEKL